MKGETAGVGAAADIGANVQAIEQHMQNMIQRDFAPFLEMLAKVTGQLADFFGWLDKINEKVADFFPGLKGNDSAAERTADNTKQAADELHRLNEGIYGGGARAQGATPSGLRPVNGPSGMVNPGASSVPYGVF
jgi:hypothetical protein